MTNSVPENRWFVNIYEVSRNYGGPEEGGWWFDSGVPIPNSNIEVESEEIARELGEILERTLYKPTSDRYSMAGMPDYMILIQNHPAEVWPAERPIYE